MSPTFSGVRALVCGPTFIACPFTAAGHSGPQSVRSFCGELVQGFAYLGWQHTVPKRLRMDELPPGCHSGQKQLRDNRDALLAAWSPDDSMEPLGLRIRNIVKSVPRRKSSRTPASSAHPSKCGTTRPEQKRRGLTFRRTSSKLISAVSRP